MTISRGPIPNLGVSAPTRDFLFTPSTREDHTFHDSRDCPYQARTTSYDDLPGAAYPRRCNWCTEHDRPTSS